MQTETTAMDDTTEFVMKYGTPTDTKGALFKRSATLVWNYIKDKISSVLGLTASDYNGRARIATNADYSKHMYLQTFDLTSLDKTKFYPLVCSHSYYFEEVAIFSEGGPGNIEFNQNRIHFDISTTGWSDTPFTLNIKEYACHDSNEITIGCIGRGEHFGVWALWLRGGLRYICQSRNSDLSLKTSDYTIFDEVFTVGTNYYGGANSNVSIVFTPQSTIKEGAYSNRPITASFIGNVSGNSATATTADKVKNALTINGQSFDGSSPVTVDTPNTDTKVTQTVSTENSDYPILASATANKSSSSTETAIFSTLLKMNPLTGNMTGWSNGSACAICSTDASVQDKVINLPGLTLTTGMTVNVFFSNGNSAENPRLKVNSNDAIPIYINKQGNLNFIVKDWEAGISMTLMFKGDSFVVLGNPIVKLGLNLVTAGSGAVRNFIRYASGLLIQWGTVITNGLTEQQIEAYTASSSYSLLATPSDGAIGWTDCRRYDKKTIKLAIKSTNTGYTDGTVSWLTIGW